MLRAAQFAARFEYEVSTATLDAMRGAAPLVGSVSAERVQDELAKLFGRARKPSIGLELLSRNRSARRALARACWRGSASSRTSGTPSTSGSTGLATVDASPASDLPYAWQPCSTISASHERSKGPHFYRHEIIGAEMARGMLERFRFPNDRRRSDRASRPPSHVLRRPDLSARPALRRFIQRVGRQISNTCSHCVKRISPAADFPSATGRTRLSRRACARSSSGSPHLRFATSPSVATK